MPDNAPGPAPRLHGVIHPFVQPDTGLFPYLSAVLQRPGRVAAQWWAGGRPHYFGPVLTLVLLVALATLVLGLLQAHHPAWAIARQASPLTLAQVALLGGRTSYWGLYHNLRQLLLLPFYALPTWLVYRRQSVRYPDALFMHVLWNTAYTIYSLLLFGMMAGQIVRITTTGNGIALLLMLIYLTAIGRTALDLRWAMAGAKAVLVGVLVMGLLKLLACMGL